MPDRLERAHELLAPLYAEILGDTVADIGGMWASELDEKVGELVELLETIKEQYAQL